MPVIHAHLIRGRSPAQKAAFARAVTEAASQYLNAPAAAVRVVFHEIEPSDWFVAGEPKATPPDPD